MRKRFNPLPVLEGAQASAVEPNIHASLSASAGTGKTQVLTGRVLRLLLSGVDPEAILCLTFTKAGAAEMANRIGARLAAWVRLRDAELRKELYALREDTGPEMLQRARRLFAKVLEAPGGLRIQTIHGFAQALLASFPAEAGITPGFTPIEGRAEQELARTTLANLIADAEARNDERLISDVQCLSLRLGEEGAAKYLMLCAGAADAMAAFGSPETIEPLLRRVMQLPDESVADFIAHQCHDDRFDCDLLQAIADANRRWGVQTGLGHAEAIDRWLSLSPIERAAALPKLRKVVMTDKDTLRVSAGQSKAEPHYEAHAGRLSNLIGELVRIQNGAKLAADMAAGLRAGQAFAASYTRAKRSAGVADFNDLIAWTRHLLATPGMGEWVRYKLDRRTDHILVDESQDTNREQWEIVQALASEFFVGLGAAESRGRSIFMVGDFKQAIFGFQGTDPQEFENARQWVRERSAALLEAQGDERSGSALEFRDLSIEASFRSAPAVLDVVDAVIDEVGYRNMGLPDEPRRHQPHFYGRPGAVELWAPFAPETDANGEEGEEGWLGEDARLYASVLAKQVRRWLDEAPVLASTKRPMTPGDVLVLVRSRGELASLIVARLFEEGVPVAGIDRLHLQEPLAVKDLLAAITFAVQPLDDLNLGNLLVSPLVGWSQELLLELAYGRGQVSLWQRLGERGDDRPEFRQARDLLTSLLAMADFTTPHRFLETILSGSMDGRRKIYARLGMAARDPIDELLSSALEFEQKEIASLDRFLAWFARGDVEIKRDPSAPSNAVRVMTVHGAKGLEAPVVILADATADPARLGGISRILSFPVPGVGSVPLLRPRKVERVTPFDTLIAAEEERDLQEHWRLLYVALTRAEERLVIAGLQPKTKDGIRPENSWHVRAERALRSLAAEELEDPAWGRVLRYRGDVAPAAIKLKALPNAVPGPAIPEWARTPAPPEARPPRPLAPSAIAEDKEAAPPPSAAMRAAAERGTLIHALLERLADVAPDQRHATALRWLERSAGLSDAKSRKEIADTVCNVLSDPSFAPLFGPGSLAEAPLAATLPDGTVVAGTVDRLLVEHDRVSVIDFKTGRVPDSASSIPTSHRAQMSAYVEALRVIFPGREVRASLLYTSGPKLIAV
ncbi:double-strand break repair helicase AddA [Sphingomonas sp. SM33]|uniref:DNA 3'-5' helicase n=1 Tax=Sphingomonas telluris TaxID=2907998 RepID=A0ABS9VKL4_9SPHN|nr:double-strand break repair helicase AddA [Sphingomonas telluris]MCH8615516.1 double-strand break repair helicase AddA [Sphingomonas telluris]